jgi:hypothetical protein
MSRSFDQIMDEVLVEEDRHGDYDTMRGSNPYSPWDVARRLATPEAVPFLV